MPYRTVQPRSDRGSIKDIQQAVKEDLGDPNLPPTPAELRIKALYEHALVTRDQALIDSLGLIVMDGSPKDPVAMLRHKEYVREISAKLGREIVQEAKEGIDILIEADLQQGPSEMRIAAYKQAEARNTILQEDGEIVKNAATGSVRINTNNRSFWRAK
jgi:hypothetical protein